jgi:hypothetical protein
MRYETQKLGLAERFLTRNILYNQETIITLEDLFNAYYNFAQCHTLADEELIDLMLTKWPEIIINYGNGTITNLVWKDQVKVSVEPPKVKDYATKLLDYRLETMFNINPKIEKSGFTPLQFAEFRKESIMGGMVTSELEPIDIKKAENYLDNNTNLQNIDGKFYKVMSDDGRLYY